MALRKMHYKEGDWFAVPLEGGGYALGLIARMRKRPRSVGLFGYFFGPRRQDVPTLADAARLRAVDAIDRLIFGDLDLLNQNWPVLGALPDWDRGKWPLPGFAHKDVISGQPYIRTYDEDSLDFHSERQVREADLVGLPPDGLYGAGAVITRLSRLIQQQEQTAAPRHASAD